MKDQNVSAHCKHGPLVPHKHKTRQRPDKIKRHELWKQCISQENHTTSHQSLVFSAVLVKANQGASLGHEWDTRKVFLFVGFGTRVADANGGILSNHLKRLEYVFLNYPQPTPSPQRLHSLLAIPLFPRQANRSHRHPLGLSGPCQARGQGTTSHASGLPGLHHSEQPSCQPRHLCEALVAQPPMLGKGYPEA